MITDPIFYRLFETSPETFFLLLGMTADLAAGMAARYEYRALELKETSHRVDGVFLPKEAGLPLYFLEVQFCHLPSVFADLLAKVYTYLKQHDPNAGEARNRKRRLRGPSGFSVGGNSVQLATGGLKLCVLLIFTDIFWV